MDSEEFRDHVPTCDLTLYSLDGRFRVYLGHCQFHFLLELCRDSGPMETGGLLIGRYNDAHDNCRGDARVGTTQRFSEAKEQLLEGCQGH